MRLQGDEAFQGNLFVLFSIIAGQSAVDPEANPWPFATNLIIVPTFLGGLYPVLAGPISEKLATT